VIDRYVQEWVLKADHDLKAAQNELTISSEEKLTDIICFHAQQAVEKYLKACLVSRNVEFGRTHKIEFLKELCIKEDKSFGILDTGNLSHFAVEIRYPGEFYMPSLEEAQKCVKLAETVRAFVLNKLKVDTADA
jgi:HEPN domain-containing protein